MRALFARRRRDASGLGDHRCLGQHDRRRDRQRGRARTSTSSDRTSPTPAGCSRARPDSRAPPSSSSHSALVRRRPAFSVTDFVLFRPLPFPRARTAWSNSGRRRPATAGWSCRRPTSATGRPPRRRTSRSACTTAKRSSSGRGGRAANPPRRDRQRRRASRRSACAAARPYVHRRGRSSWRSGDGHPELSLWQSEFGGDPFIVGRSLVLDECRTP